MGMTSRMILLLVCVQAIYDFRFLTLMAIGGSLVGSLLCFLKVSLEFFLY